MNVDDLDLNIFVFFMESEQSTHTIVDVAKGVYKPKNRNELIKLVSRITYRLKKWVELNIFKIDMENGVKIYSINHDKVYYDDSSLSIGPEVLDFGKALVLTIADGYFIYFLERIE